MGGWSHATSYPEDATHGKDHSAQWLHSDLCLIFCTIYTAALGLFPGYQAEIQELTLLL